MEKLIEENIPRLTENQVQEIVDSDLTDDELSRRLFHRPADYVIDTCNRCWLEDYHYFHSMTRLGLKTCFMKRNAGFQNARINPNEYKLGMREALNSMLAERNSLMSWYLDVCEQVEWMEHNGHAKLYKPGFFESINTNFTDANRIKEIAMDENLNDDQKCEKLWDRDYKTFLYSGLLNMELIYCNSLPVEVKQRIRNDRDRFNRAREKVFDARQEFGINEFCLTHNDGESTPLTVDESFMVYTQRGLPGEVSFNRYETYHDKYWKEHYTVLTWWDYIKKSIEAYEDFDILEESKPYKPGFFENRNDVNDLTKQNLNEEQEPRVFNAGQIRDIVMNDDLTDDEKSDMLFGKPFDYVSDTVNLNFARRHDYPSSYHYSCTNCGCYTVFCGGNLSEPLTMKQSFIKYTLAGSSSSVLGWYSDITSSLNYWETHGVATPPEKYKPGFFNEAVETTEDGNTWLRNNFGISFEELEKLCDWNYENASAWVGPWYELRWDEEGTDIVSIVIDCTSVDSFDNMKEVLDYYGEDFCKAFIPGLLQTAEEAGFEFKRKIGFFENLTVDKFNSLDNNLIKRVILKYVKEHGYLRGDYGYSNPNGTSYRGSPTVAAITSILDNNAEDLQQVACTPEDLEKMNNWVNNITPEQTQHYEDYFRNGIETWNKEHLDKSNLPLVCSFCNTYFNSEKRLQQQREREQREREHQLEVQSPSNVHAGQVGDVVQFVIAEAHVTRWINPGYYNSREYPVWQIKDTQGKLYSWGDTKNEIELEQGMMIEAKIKELQNWKGLNVTKIWRLKVIKDISSIGFFS